MANMMFPDTSNDQQLAALRRTAERYRAANNSPIEHERERETRKPLPPMREGFNADGAYEPEHFVSARKKRSLASR
jgi:hypothetical protein